MRETLPAALDYAFGDEGGYVNAKTDAGGPTKYGITHATLADSRGVERCSAEDVKNLTREEAAEIYSTGYWAQSGGDVLPVGLDYAAFDFGVNSGPARAVRTLQRVVGVKEDGSIGPATLAAVRRYDGGVTKLIVDYCDARMAFLRSLKNPKTGFPVNGRGWTIRVTGVDPLGKWKPKPGVVGTALALARGRAAEATALPEDVAPAKAVPAPTNAWLKPETVVQVVPALGGIVTVFNGTGPVQIALGVVLVLGAAVAAYWAVRRIRREVV